MSLRMSYIQIIGLKAELQAVIDTLYQLGCVQIDRFTDLQESSIAPLSVDLATIHAQEELSLALMQAKGLLEILHIDETTQPEGAEEATIEDALAGISGLLPTVQRFSDRRKKLQAEMDVLPRFERTLRKLLPLLTRVSRGPEHALFGLFISKAHSGVLDGIRNHLDRLSGGQVELATGDVDEATSAVLIASPKPYAEEIGKLLDHEDITQLRLPTEFDDRSPDRAITALHQRLEALPEEMAAIERDLAQLSHEWAARVMAWHNTLREQQAKYDVLTHLGQTESTFVLIGWTPSRDLGRVEKTLHDAVGERVLVQSLPLTAEAKKRAPVALSNPQPSRPFEGLIRLFGLPHYERFDPTGLVAIFLPAFFGLMLGDVGYGVLLLVLCLILRSRMKAGMMRDLATILAIGSVWSIIFGFVFGELFGTLGEHIGMHPLWFDRASPEHLMDLLALTIGIGAAHITLGLLIGVWDSLREKNKHHLFERGGRLLGLIALFTIVGVLVKFLPQGFMTAAVAGLIVAIVLMARSLGGIGFVVAPIELIGLVGNVLSYLRIAAIGLASVYLARVANEMAGAMGSLVVGLIIAVLLHALNFVLGAFSPTVHSLRLHYVEFFRNFYVSGGKPYAPFGPRLVPGTKSR